jgi:hypothetical protein
MPPKITASESSIDMDLTLTDKQATYLPVQGDENLLDYIVDVAYHYLSEDYEPRSV